MRPPRACASWSLYTHARRTRRRPQSLRSSAASVAQAAPPRRRLTRRRAVFASGEGVDVALLVMVSGGLYAGKHKEKIVKMYPEMIDRLLKDPMKPRRASVVVGSPWMAAAPRALRAVHIPSGGQLIGRLPWLSGTTRR